jgi:hypothetical protein
MQIASNPGGTREDSRRDRCEPDRRKPDSQHRTLERGVSRVEGYRASATSLADGILVPTVLLARATTRVAPTKNRILSGRATDAIQARQVPLRGQEPRDWPRSEDQFRSIATTILMFRLPCRGTAHPDGEHTLGCNTNPRLQNESLGQLQVLERQFDEPGVDWN